MHTLLHLDLSFVSPFKVFTWLFQYQGRSQADSDCHTPINLGGAVQIWGHQESVQCTQLYFLTLFCQHKREILLFPPLSGGLSNGTRRQMQLDPVVRDGGREGQDPGECYVLGYAICLSGRCQVRSVEVWNSGEHTTEPVMTCLSIHPCTGAVRRENVFSEGLSYPLPPLSPGK